MRRWKRLRRHVRILIAAAVSLWLTMFSLAGAEAFGVGADLPRSMAQGAAVTLSIAAFVFSRRSWEVARDGRVTSPENARVVETYVSSHALLDCNPITMELPRQRRVAETASAMSGGHRSPRRSQDYWDGFADVAETLLERREDDPDPDPH